MNISARVQGTSARRYFSAGLLLCAFASTQLPAATTVPMEVKMPGTQPEDGVSLDLNGGCDQCHEDSADGVSIVSDWRGSMMSHAGRDPIFWATVAIAEQDFDGSGDLCIRCHTMSGWLTGESTPTDGSALSLANAAEGVGCEVCHVMTNPDNSEFVGVQTFPFIPNDGGSPAEGYYGSAQLSMWGGNERLGPYSDANAKHKWDQSQFHRDVDFCGSCHDVSNPVVGDLAPNHGAQQPLAAGSFDGQLDTPGNPRNIEDKAAFNNPPYKYGVVERTYSEYKASSLSQTLVSAYPGLPPELQDGAIQDAYIAAMGAGTGGNYEDGTPRYFSCQTCHMKPTTALGCNKQNVLLRADQPTHDLTGGNYWMPDVIQYMDGEDTLVAGGDLSALENSGIQAGKLRAMNNLESAAALSVSGNTLTVTNLTGHKLISGYPEGRRMWLNVKWYDAGNGLLREDGEYGSLALGYDIDGTPGNDSVDTLLDLHDPDTRIYEAHGAITKDWAVTLNALGLGGVPVNYDRETGAVIDTVADVAALPNADDYIETFHFVLNNKVVKDNRIPPYGMDYDESLLRSILPVPATQYGDPGPGGTFDHFDAVALNPPAGADHAEIRLMYQPTSWEYIQFLAEANNGTVAFLANEGANLLDAWLNTGMAAPHMMAQTTWNAPDSDGDGVVDTLDNCPDDSNPLQEDYDGDNLGDVCDTDDDNDGLSDSEEELYNGIAGYQPGEDPNPMNADTDGDGYLDGNDPVPLHFNYEDGNVAPVGNLDLNTDAADMLIIVQVVLGLRDETDEILAHADLYPENDPDGEITLSDLVLLQQLLW